MTNLFKGKTGASPPAGPNNLAKSLWRQDLRTFQACAEAPIRGAILGCRCTRSGEGTIIVLERLLELGKRVLAESDLDRVLTAALDGVIELCGAERGMILLFDTEGPEGEVVVETARNLAREDIERAMAEAPRYFGRMPRSSCSVRAV